MSTPISNCHDVYFKRVLGEPALSLKAGGNAYAYVLMEHKSKPDPAARLQLLRYVVRLLIDCYERNGKRLPLLPVLPLLANQGPQGWTFSTQFMDLFGDVPEALRPYVPSFRHALVDLTEVDDEDLSTDPRLRAFMKALKYCRRSDLGERLTVVLAEALTLSPSEREVVVTYLCSGPRRVEYNKVREVLLQIAPHTTESVMPLVNLPTAEEFKEHCRAEEKARVLIRFLEKRFGTLSYSTRLRIFFAKTSEVDSWIDRVLDAPDLSSVLDSN